MLRKLFLSTVVCLLLAGVLPVTVFADKDYHAETFEVLVDVQPDGSLLVTETVTFRFNGGPFTYVFREIPRVELDDIQVREVAMDGVVLPAGEDAGQSEIVDGNPVRVTWHFEPVSNSTHIFVLSYRVEGAIHHAADTDIIFWRAIPAGHEYLVKRSVIQIRYPSGLVPLGDPILHGSAFEIEEGQGQVIFTSGEIPPDTEVKAELSFPAGSLVDQPPAWQVEMQQQAQRSAMGAPFGLGAAGITIFLGLIGVILAGRSFRRETTISQNDAYQSFSAPPRAIPPALASKLAGNGVPFLGTLFDLTRRGVLRIEEGPRKWGSRTFDVIHQPTGERLLPHEQAFLDTLFKKARHSRVAMSDIASLAHTTQFSLALDQELTTAGWRDAERSSRRGRFLSAAGLALALGIAVFFAGLLIGGMLHITDYIAVVAGAILMGVGCAAFGVGLLALIVALAISTLSDEGVQLASAWNSFAGYLRNITRGREPVAAPDLFERYLPYAAGLGLATEWAKFFQKQANVPIPEWLMSLQSGLDDGSFVAIMAAVSAADSSASVATGADGGGGSGGGSSGAG